MQLALFWHLADQCAFSAASAPTPPPHWHKASTWDCGFAEGACCSAVSRGNQTTSPHVGVSSFGGPPCFHSMWDNACVFLVLAGVSESPLLPPRPKNPSTFGPHEAKWCNLPWPLKNRFVSGDDLVGVPRFWMVKGKPTGHTPFWGFPYDHPELVVSPVGFPT